MYFNNIIAYFITTKPPIFYLLVSLFFSIYITFVNIIIIFYLYITIFVLFIIIAMLKYLFWFAILALL